MKNEMRKRNEDYLVGLGMVGGGFKQSDNLPKHLPEGENREGASEASP